MRVCVKVRSSELIVVAVTTLLIFFPLTSVHAGSPTAKIVSIDYPSHVFPGQSFPVTVVVDFSDKFGIDVGIWNAQTGAVIQSVSIPLPKAGKASFDFKLTAPPAPGEWRLLAMTRVWWQDAWYEDPKGGSRLFTVAVSASIVVTLSSRGATSTISVDGSQYQVDENKSTRLSINPGPYRLEASPPIQTQGTKRFVFIGWSDGVNSNPRQILLSEDTQVTALYRTEYYLSVKSDRGKASGAGWYEEGSEANFAVIPSSSVVVWFGLLTEYYHFSGWSGNSDSKDVVASIVMNGPKNVEAEWAQSDTSINLHIVGGVLVLGTLVLAGRGLYKYSRQRRQGARVVVRLMKRWNKLIALVAVLLMGFVMGPSTYAQLPDRPDTSIVRIGDASWYYWKQPAGDTCLLWLGGGISQETVIGYDTYWINPFDYESFGTVRFIQDLAKFYCVIALQKGSFVRPLSDRTIYQEAYQLQSRILVDVQDWIRKEGYQHTYLVGYSSGAQAASMEAVIRAPEHWTSPDGLVLITPRLASRVIQHAPQLRGSLLVLYGGSIETPEYLATGREFYDSAPQDGWYGSYYLHKEFRVIEKMGHEVWTTYKTGTYDTQALQILVNFVENSKALQFKSEDVARFTSQNFSVQSSAMNLTSVQAPRQVSPSQILSIEVELTYSLQNRTVAQVLAFDKRNGRVVSATTVPLVGDGRRTVDLAIVPPSNSSELSFGVIALENAGEVWIPAAGPLFTVTTVKNTLTVKLQTSISNASIWFDGVQYVVPESEAVRLDTGPGVHIVQVEPVVHLNTLTRALFTQWDDGTTEPIRQVNLDNETSLVAFYRIQYYVNATSPYGNVKGSGWYDQNSTTTLSVQPPMIEQAEVIFTHWAGDSSDDHPRALLFVNSPKRAEAIWNSLSDTGKTNDLGAVVWFAVSLLIFAILMIWNLKQISQPTVTVNFDRKVGSGF